MRLRKLFLTSSALLLSAGTLCGPKLFAQTSPSPADPQTLRVYSREVVVDVNVTDSKDNPVHGLTRANFIPAQDER